MSGKEVNKLLSVDAYTAKNIFSMHLIKRTYGVVDDKLIQMIATNLDDGYLLMEIYDELVEDCGLTIEAYKTPDELFELYSDNEYSLFYSFKIAELLPYTEEEDFDELDLTFVTSGGVGGLVEFVHLIDSDLIQNPEKAISDFAKNGRGCFQIGMSDDGSLDPFDAFINFYEKFQSSIGAIKDYISSKQNKEKVLHAIA